MTFSKTLKVLEKVAVGVGGLFLGYSMWMGAVTLITIALAFFLIFGGFFLGWQAERIEHRKNFARSSSQDTIAGVPTSEYDW